MKRLAQLLALTLTLLVVPLVVIRTGESKNSAQTPDAAALFNRYCASCHGKDGRAKTMKAKFKGARDLTNAKWQTDVTDERIFNSITQGKGRMPSFSKKLSTEETEAMVPYVRGLKKAPEGSARQ
jgi:mono/diheme cytochrome c family protein